MTIETKYSVGDTVYIIFHSKIEEVTVIGFNVVVCRDITRISYNVVSDKLDFDLLEDKLIATKKEAEKELDIQLSEGLEKDVKLLLQSYIKRHLELGRRLSRNPKNEGLLASVAMMEKCYEDITGVINKNK